MGKTHPTTTIVGIVGNYIQYVKVKMRKQLDFQSFQGDQFSQLFIYVYQKNWRVAEFEPYCLEINATVLG